MNKDAMHAAILQQDESFFFTSVFPAIEKDQSVADAVTVLQSVQPDISSVWRERVRKKALSLLDVFVPHFEPGPAGLALHKAVCTALWDAAEQNSLHAIQVFLRMYRSEQVLLDAELTGRLQRFVQWLRLRFSSASRENLREYCLAVSVLLQSFSSATDVIVSAVLGDLVRLLAVEDVEVEVKSKILTIIAFVSKSGRSAASDYVQIAKQALSLLKLPLSPMVRRELLLSLRSCFHSPDMCVAFVPFIDELFDEANVVGTGMTCFELLRPVVISALADFANAVKDKIPLEKLRKVLSFFCANVTDGDLAVSGQFTSARIVLNLIDQVFNKSSNRLRKIGLAPGSADGSDLLREVLRTVTEKFSALTLFLPQVIALDLSTSPNHQILFKLVGGQRGSLVPPADLLIEGVREVRSLVRTLLLCAKMTVHCLCHRVSGRFLTKSDLHLLDSLMEDSIKVSHLVSCAAGSVQSLGFDLSCGHSSANGGGRFATASELAVACSVQEERELLEQVASVFVIVPANALTEILSKRFSWLLDSIRANAQLMALCNGLIQNPDTMTVLCEVLFGFLAAESDRFFTESTSHLARHLIVDNLEQDEQYLRSLLFLPENSTRKKYMLESSSCSSSFYRPLALDESDNTYVAIVKQYGLRESAIGIQDVVVTIAKSLSRQVASANFLEQTVRPFVVPITFVCLRVARSYPSSAAYCGGVLKYMFRLMGAGSKTASTVKEFADLAPAIMHACMEIARKNSSAGNIWMEVALTLPLRLKALIAHFESAVACLTECLETAAAAGNSPETIATALSVLESWVDGLTPDFLFPLIPGHRTHSLSKLLYLITKPPGEQVIHSTASGNNSVRATKLLGKLGARAKFTLDSHNLVGYKKEEEFASDAACVWPRFPVSVCEGVVGEVRLDAGLKKCMQLLEMHACKFEPLPVSLQDPPGDSAAVPMIPEQDLLDALNLVFTFLAEGRTARRIARALLAASLCPSRTVSERAKNLISELLTASIESLVKIDASKKTDLDYTACLSPLLLAAIDAAEFFPECCLSVISQLVAQYPPQSRPSKCLALIASVLAEKLEHPGSSEALLAMLSLPQKTIAGIGPLVIDRCISFFPSVPVQVQSKIFLLAERLVWSLNLDSAKEITLVVLKKFVDLPSSGLAESLLHILAAHMQVSLATLIQWVDEDFSIIIAGLCGDRPCAVFNVASFVLLMRPVPVLTVAGDKLHAGLTSAIRKGISWLEKEDELALVYAQDLLLTGGAAQQMYLVQRECLRRSLLQDASMEKHKVIEGLRLMKLTLMHAISTSFEESVHAKMISILARSLLSFDPEVAAAAKHALSVLPTALVRGNSSLVPLVKEVVARQALSVNEVAGLGNLLEIFFSPDEIIRLEIADRLFEKLHTYLGLLRERTFSPLVQHAPSWRACVGPDSVIPLAVSTMQCFSSLVSEKLPFVEKLLTLAAQLDVSLPSSFGAGSLMSPFLQPLIPALTKDPERTADQLLTKTELGKIFPFVAELISLRPCLNLRKALQDKCHHMSLMDTGGVLMMRTAASSLTAVLAKHDPSYLWVQYCSSKTGSSSPGATRSLIESLIRVWENSVASLTAASHTAASGPSCLSAGGILGPIDTSGAVTSAEGRAIANTIIQFLSRPGMIALGDNVIDSSIRVRLFIRLATSLALKFGTIEIQSVQGWFLTTAASLTSLSEKKDIVSKSIDAIAENAVSEACKFALLRYLVIPQMDPDILSESTLEKIDIIFAHPHHTESVLSELCRLALSLGPHKRDLDSLIDNCMRSEGAIVKQLAALCAATASSALLPAALNEILCTEIWKDIALEIANRVPTNNKAIVDLLKSKLEQAEEKNAPAWKWFLLLAPKLSVSAQQELLGVCHLFISKNRGSGSTELRLLVLEVALLVAEWAPSDALANLLLYHAVAGPECGTGASPVSPTLLGGFLDKCEWGIGKCMHAKLNNLEIIERLLIFSDPPRLAKQLVALNRMLAQWFRSSPQTTLPPEPGHLAHLIGVSLVSTDKAVASSLAYLLEVIASRFEFPAVAELLEKAASPNGTMIVFRQILLGIQSGLQVAGNKTGLASRLRVHPLNPHSPAYLVTPYTAVSASIGLLRGFALKGKNGEKIICAWLLALQPLLVKAVSQSSRSLVLGLLPQSLHAFAMAEAPVLEDPVHGGSSFAYPGSLQSAEQAVPSLLEIIRLAHLASDLLPAVAASQDFRDSIVWLIQVLGPFLTFASPSHQTFAHLLNGLNLTVPQQNQKPGGISGNLSSLVTVVQLSALVRHCLDIVGRWGFGPSSDTPVFVDIGERKLSLGEKKLCLSLTTALVGPAALRACCNVDPVVALLAANKGFCDTKFFIEVVLPKIFESIDGLAVLARCADASVKKLLGFIPQTSVTSFPVSAIAEDCHLASSKSGLGGLLAMAADLVLHALSLLPVKEYAKLSSCLLIGACSREKRIRSKFVKHLIAIVPEDPFHRLEYIFKTAPWHVVSSRLFLPVMVQILAARADDGALNGPRFPWVDSLLSLAEGGNSDEICFSLWSDLFPPMMASLTLDKQQAIANSIIEFLTRSHMNKQSFFPFNVARAILASLEFSLPVPVLVHCATYHGVWFEALEILHAMRGDHSNAIDEINSAIEYIFSQLGEKDSLSDEVSSTSAVSQLSQGKFQEARSIIERHTKQQGLLSPVWLEATKSLSEWSRLLDVANEVKDPELRLEIFGKSNEWGQVADLMAQYDWSSKGGAKLFAAYLALSFSDSCHTGSDVQSKQRLFLADMEASINRSFHQVVSRWGFLPDISIVDGAKELILQTQEFVEFSEASSLVSDIRAAITGSKSTYPTPKQLLNTWRDRLPEKNDAKSNWFELLSLRTVIFRHIQQQCAVDVVASSHIAPYMQDYPWTLVKLAQVSSAENPLLAQNMLNRFQQSLTRSTDAFNQELFEALKEQIKLYASSPSELDWKVGLNVLNCCAISNSNSQQAAEISWMQGRLMRKLGMTLEAKEALLVAVNTYPMITKAWVDIGDLIWNKVEAESANKDEMEECLKAYMLAVTLRPSRATRLVPRMLLLAKKGCVSLAEKCVDSQPSSVWISWVPLLVKCLSDESLEKTAKALLLKLAVSFPQSVFFALQGSPAGEEILEKIKTEEHSSVYFKMERFRSFLAGIGANHLDDPQTAAYFKVATTLEELRFKRITPAAAKTKLHGIAKIDVSETGLSKWLKTESAKQLDLLSSVREGLFAPEPLSFPAGDDLLEIPGNYSRFISVPAGSTLESMSWVKIKKVVPEYELIKGVCGGLEPRVTLVGSNGLLYSYCMRLGSVDGAGMQTCALVNGLLDKFSQSKQRGLAYHCLQSFSLSPTVYVEEAPAHVRSFDRIVGAEKAEESVASFKKQVESSTGSKNHERIAFEHMDYFPETLLLTGFVESETAEEFYASSKRFSKSFAVISMLDHLLGVSAVQRPLNQWLIAKDGRLFVNDSSVSLSGTPSLYSVPFRLTRNVVALIGERNLAGLLPASMRAVVDCLERKRIGFLELLSLLAPDAVGVVEQRLEQIIKHEPVENLFAKIHELLNESRDSRILAAVNPKQWLPWM